VSVDPRFERLRARARSAESTPAWLRGSADALPAFEHRAVRKVVEWSGVGSLPELKREAARYGDSGLFTFPMFHGLYEFPVRLTAGRFRFHFDALAVDLFNDPTRTTLWSAYDDARSSRPGGRLGLVFAWPKVRKCGNLCVFHDVPRDEEAVLAGASRRKGDPRVAFRLTVPVAGRFYHVEPMPAFLASIGRYGGHDREDGRDEGGPDESEG